MRNAGLDDSQAEIKIARRNSNNFRYVDDTTLMAESKEELKGLLIRVKNTSRGGKYQITLLAFWEIYMQVKKQQLEPDMEQ